MTVRQFYSEYWKPLFMTIVPTIFLTVFASYVGVKIAITEIQKDVYYLQKQLDEHIDEFGFYKEKDKYQGESLFRLQMNQLSLSKDCKIELPYKFENLNTRGIN